jgi:hypothetical protein
MRAYAHAIRNSNFVRALEFPRACLFVTDLNVSLDAPLLGAIFLVSVDGEIHQSFVSLLNFPVWFQTERTREVIELTQLLSGNY